MGFCKTNTCTVYIYNEIEHLQWKQYQYLFLVPLLLWVNLIFLMLSVSAT